MAGAGGGGGAGGDGHGDDPVIPRMWQENLTQPQVKLFVPPRASVWISHARHEWWGHIKPHRRIFETFARHGSSISAARALLRRLWEIYLVEEGLEAKDCPHTGLF